MSEARDKLRKVLLDMGKGTKQGETMRDLTELTPAMQEALKAFATQTELANLFAPEQQAMRAVHRLVSKEGETTRQELARLTIDKQEGRQADAVEIQQLSFQIGEHLDRIAGKSWAEYLDRIDGWPTSELPMWVQIGGAPESTGHAVELPLKISDEVTEKGAALLNTDCMGILYLCELGKAGRQVGQEALNAALERSGDRSMMWHWWFNESDDLTPVRFARALAVALWHDVVKPELVELRERERKTPVAQLHPGVVTAIIRAPGRVSTIGDAGELVQTDGEDWTVTLPASAMVTLAEGALGTESVVVGLIAYLAIEAHRRWLAGVPNHRFVPIRAGKHALSAVLGGTKITEADMCGALDWLSEFKVGQSQCVCGYWAEPQISPKGGRPSKGYVVHTGPVLAPHGLDRVFQEANVDTPPELRFWSPVMNPAEAPLRGDHRTFNRQRDAYAVGLGLYLTQRREEYSDKGGVLIEPKEWRSWMNSQGIYHRSHKSLADDVLEAWTRPRQSDLFKRGPVLVELEHDPGRYRLGPAYEKQHQAIVTKAGITQRARKAAKDSNDQQGKRRKRRKRSS